MARYEVPNVNEHMSFLEMLDVLNEDLIAKDEEPVAFDHDCREGICGMCGSMVNGVAHGPKPGTTLCQLHMRFFKDGDELYLEPWRARAFPIVKDLVVDRSAFDRVMAAGGFISVATGSAPDGNAILVSWGVAAGRSRGPGAVVAGDVDKEVRAGGGEVEQVDLAVSPRRDDHHVGDGLAWREVEVRGRRARQAVPVHDYCARGARAHRPEE